MKRSVTLFAGGVVLAAGVASGNVHAEEMASGEPATRDGFGFQFADALQNGNDRALEVFERRDRRQNRISGDASMFGESSPEPTRRQFAQAAGQPVGEEPEERRPEVEAIRERGGVLTRQGTLILEPSFEFQHDNVSRFVAGGVQIIDTVLLGVIEVTEAQRNVLTAAMTARYGVTDRFEVEVKVPYLYRDEERTTTIVEPDPEGADTRSISAHNIGDVEFAGHYQLTTGTGFLPVTVGNLRVKSDTGRGPFDIDRDLAGQETEPSTGSGFWSLEPSVTMLIPSDPVVFFTNVGYLVNLSRDVETVIGDVQVERVRPGNAFRGSFGMAFGLNQQVSMSLGYSHDFIQKTETVIDGQTRESDSLQVGALSLGAHYQFSERAGLNVNVQAGVTDDAPDVRLMFRLPITFNLF